jgi:Raf kinase inhibitor-like YbhB/YbcL family protein
MKLTSTAFEAGAPIPAKHTCLSSNLNPPLNIEAVPPSTQSLALIVHDPDAPSGNWIHWVVWNLNPKTNQINPGKPPNQAIQGINDFGENNYSGPCPPSGTHHYYFTLYALDTKLALDHQSSSSDLIKTMSGHIITTAELIGTFSAP